MIFTGLVFGGMNSTFLVAGVLLLEA